MLYRVVVAMAAVAAMVALPGVAQADVAVDVAQLELEVGSAEALSPLRLVEGHSGDIPEGTGACTASR